MMNVRQYVQFSDLVRAIRAEKGLSQRAMASALDVSPGYVGQWELQRSQPSTQMATKLCEIFGIDDVEYVRRLAYAQRAPEWLRESILRGRDVNAGPMLRPIEQRVVDVIRCLPYAATERLAERIEGWVEALATGATVDIPTVWGSDAQRSFNAMGSQEAQRNDVTQGSTAYAHHLRNGVKGDGTASSHREQETGA